MLKAGTPSGSAMFTVRGGIRLKATVLAPETQDTLQPSSDAKNLSGTKTLLLINRGATSKATFRPFIVAFALSTVKDTTLSPDITETLLLPASQAT